MAERDGAGMFARASGSRAGGGSRDLPVGVLVFSATCLSSSRSGKRLKKTRKYDIITTPAERVEMAPLNEEDDEDEDSTVFDIKYRYGVGTQLPPGLSGVGVAERFTLENNVRPGVASTCPCSLVACLDFGTFCLRRELLGSLPRMHGPQKASTERTLEQRLLPHSPDAGAGEVWSA